MLSVTSTSSKIRRLPQEVAAQIAAGEVVERPASVVKELLENALDAGASTVEVFLEQGGLKCIELRDDGCGLHQDDLLLAVEEHATSKVSQYEDLFNLHTLGFRGEALSAISRVSQFSLLSCAEPGQAHELGPDGSIQPAVRDMGTTVRVQDLFYNTPARRKFMKSAQKELAACVEIVLGYALMRPEVGFSLQEGNKSVIKSPAQSGLDARVAELFGLEAFKGLVPVSTGQGPVEIKGFLSRPSITRSDPRKLFLLVNGRLVQDRWITSSLLGLYRGLLAPRKYPFGVLQVEIDPELVDVNVHPTKREVRFSENGPVYMALSRAVDQATRVVGAFSDAHSESLNPGLTSFSSSQSNQPFGFSAGPAFAPLRESLPAFNNEPSPSNFPNQTNHAYASQAAFVQAPINQGAYRGQLRFLAQLYTTYLLFTLDGVPYLADQHVAHERVLFETYAKALRERGTVPTQGLLVPFPLNLGPSDVLLIAQYQEELSRYGVEAEPFGDDAVLIRGLPYGRKMGPHRVRELLLDLCQTLETPGQLSERDQAMAARLSCRGAVMAGDTLDHHESLELLKKLLETQNPDTCPHGRPIISRLKEDELAPRFHRPKKREQP